MLLLTTTRLVRYVAALGKCKLHACVARIGPSVRDAAGVPGCADVWRQGLQEAEGVLRDLSRKADCTSD